MKNNLDGKSKDIIKVLFGINIIMLMFSIFSIGNLKFSIIINMVFMGSFFIIEKHSSFFGNMTQKQKTSKFLNNVLGRLNG